MRCDRSKTAGAPGRRAATPGCPRPPHPRKALLAVQRAGVVGAQAGLEDAKRTRVEVAGVVEVALVADDGGQAVQALGGVGVVGAKAGLADRQGASMQGLGVVEVALG